MSDNLTIRPAGSSTLQIEQLSMFAFLTPTTGMPNTQCWASFYHQPYFLIRKKYARTKFLDFVAEHETRRTSWFAIILRPIIFEYFVSDIEPERRAVPAYKNDLVRYG